VVDIIPANSIEIRSVFLQSERNAHGTGHKLGTTRQKHNAADAAKLRRHKNRQDRPTIECNAKSKLLSSTQAARTSTST